MSKQDYVNSDNGELQNERLQRAADRLVSVFQHEHHNPRGAETKALERMLAKLKQAQTIAGELSPNNRQRIFGSPVDLNGLSEIIEATETAIEQPLPSKAKLENLYHTMAFDFELATGRKPTLSQTGSANLFQTFMALIVCRIDGRPGMDYGSYIERTTQHYKRVVQSQKK